MRQHQVTSSKAMQILERSPSAEEISLDQNSSDRILTSLKKPVNKNERRKSRVNNILSNVLKRKNKLKKDKRLKSVSSDSMKEANG